MMQWLIYGMVYSGALLMVWNIICFVRYARFMQKQKSWRRRGWLLQVPIVLLLLFLAGYLLVGIIGEPDLIVASILFGGSVFVFIIYLLLSRITQQIIEEERLEAELSAKEESSRMKTRFLATMSHEMKTPMNVILGLDTLALKNPQLHDLSCQINGVLFRVARLHADQGHQPLSDAARFFSVHRYIRFRYPLHHAAQSNPPPVYFR